MAHDPQAILLDILKSGQLIELFTHNLSEAEYLSDPLVQAGVERHFEIIGEALTRLKRLRPDWWSDITDANRIIGFRNVLAHGYDLVSDYVVWQSLQEKLPVLLIEVQGLLAANPSLPPSDPSIETGPSEA